MIVLLCHDEDAAALWLHRALREHGLAALELVSVEQLVYSRSIVHRLDDRGDRGEIRLADGRVLRPQSIDALLNRVRYLPTQHFARADEADRTYASQELNAFVLAWLDSIAGCVINPALPFALDGGTFDPVTVMHYAAMAGLPTGGWRGASEQRASAADYAPRATHATIVFGRQIFGAAVPHQFHESCVRLAALVGVPLLQLVFDASPAQWRFVAATGVADFRVGGEPLMRALHATLVNAA